LFQKVTSSTVSKKEEVESMYLTILLMLPKWSIFLMSGKWLMNSDKHMNKTITEKRNFAKARFFFNTQRKELV